MQWTHWILATKPCSSRAWICIIRIQKWIHKEWIQKWIFERQVRNAPSFIAPTFESRRDIWPSQRVKSHELICLLLAWQSSGIHPCGDFLFVGTAHQVSAERLMEGPWEGMQTLGFLWFANLHERLYQHDLSGSSDVWPTDLELLHNLAPRPAPCSRQLPAVKPCDHDTRLARNSPFWNESFYTSDILHFVYLSALSGHDFVQTWRPIWSCVTVFTSFEEMLCGLANVCFSSSVPLRSRDWTDGH